MAAAEPTFDVVVYQPFLHPSSALDRPATLWELAPPDHLVELTSVAWSKGVRFIEYAKWLWEQIPAIFPCFIDLYELTRQDTAFQAATAEFPVTCDFRYVVCGEHGDVQKCLQYQNTRGKINSLRDAPTSTHSVPSYDFLASATDIPSAMGVIKAFELSDGYTAQLIAVVHDTLAEHGAVMSYLLKRPAQPEPTLRNPVAPPYVVDRDVNCIGYAYGRAVCINPGGLRGASLSSSAYTSIAMVRGLIALDGINEEGGFRFSRWADDLSQSPSGVPAEPDDVADRYVIAVFISQARKKDRVQKKKQRWDIHMARRGPDGFWYHKPGELASQRMNCLAQLSLATNSVTRRLTVNDNTSLSDSEYMLYTRYRLVGYVSVPNKFHTLPHSDWPPEDVWEGTATWE